VSLRGLISTIENEHPELAPPVVMDGVTSWRLPTSWCYLAREEGSSLLVAVSRGERPAAWIPMTQSEAMICLRWFLRRKR